MVTVSLEPPPSRPRPVARSRRAPWIAAIAAVLVVAEGGFWLGRKTAHVGFSTESPSGRREADGAPATGTTDALQQGPVGASSGTAATSGTTAAAPAGATGAPGPVPSSSGPGGGVPDTSPLGPSEGARRIDAVVTGALEDTVAAALPPRDRSIAEELTQIVNRLLVWSLQVARDGRRGDRLEVLYAPAGVAGPGLPPAREPVVYAVRYASRKLAKTFAAYRFQPPGSPWARYYRADGSEVEERLVDGPIADYEQVTSLLKDGRRHKGVDFKTPVGTPVVSPVDGVVERRNWNFAGNGNCLDIRDAGSGRHAIFLHLEVTPRDMQPGRAVHKGERIATSGNSGHSTAPHLHYQLEGADGQILDPFEVHAVRRILLEGPAAAAFAVERARLDEALAAPQKEEREPPGRLPSERHG